LSDRPTADPHDRARQLVLDLGHRSAHGVEDFLVASSNRDAVAWLDLWPDWPGSALSLIGPEGSGKTHLVRIFAERANGEIIESVDIANRQRPDLIERFETIILEDADCGVDEEALLHLFNRLAESGRFLLVTCRRAPAQWPIALPDLRSRLMAAPAAILQPPGDDLIAAVLVKTLSDRQLPVGNEVVRFVLPRLERTFAAVHEFVARLDAQALAEHRRITVPLAKTILEAMRNRKEKD
jgi:DnaA regulatory inactivator Hda